jgi:hypothetical protein
VIGLPFTAFGKDKLVVAHPVMTMETRSTDIRRRSMNRAYTAPQRAAKLEALGRADAYEAGFADRGLRYAREHAHPLSNSANPRRGAPFNPTADPGSHS